MEENLKQLLFKDLCARLPYGIFVKENRKSLNDSPIIYTYDYHPYIDNCKPYLRPMSSMTEEEKRFYKKYFNWYEQPLEDMIEFIDWLNAHHFDYRGLIEKGLALEAPKEMYE